ncbi:hypothetical protein [Sphingomonas sp. RS2018]
MRVLLLIAVGLAATSPASAQLMSRQSTSATTVVQDEEQPPAQPQQRQTPLDTNAGGRTASASVGQVGQRQTRETTAQQAGIEPMARIASRVQNRVQNRIRNRIDRYYDPRANATDPFIVAGDQARRGGRRR